MINYIYNDNNKKNKMVFIDVFINNNEALKEFRKIKCDLIRRKLITEEIKIFVRADPIFIRSKESNFYLYYNDLYENILSSGDNQHYSQRFFMNSFIENCEEQSYWYICRSDKNDPKPLNIKKNQFKSIGCDENYFSKKSEPFLDVFISSMEEESNDIIRMTNKKLKNNDFSFSQTEIDHLFNLCALPLFLKSSYNINDFNYCINKAYEHFILDNNIPDDNAAILKKEVIDPKSEYYYHCLNPYIINSFLDKQNYFKFDSIRTVKLKDIPLSENILFYYKNGLSIGYDNSLNHSIFLFNNKTVFIFYNKHESEDKIIEISKFLELELIPFIKNNAHDFLVTKERENIKKLNKRISYSNVDMSNIIEDLYGSVMCLNGKTQYSTFKRPDTLLFSFKTIYNKELKKDEFRDKICFFAKKTPISPNTIYLNDEELYVSDKDYDYLTLYQNYNYSKDNSLFLNPEPIEMVYNYSFSNEKDIDYFHKPPIFINNSSNTRLLHSEDKKIIKTITFHQERQEYGQCLFLEFNFGFLQFFVSNDIYIYFQEHATNLISSFEMYSCSKRYKEHFSNTLINEITFNFYNDFTCSYSLILK